ncbi:PqqD family peptide modification chaperone [Sphingomonas sp.]|uniref:PqqD family peptide modification chaperone n=1 Tax=Sphingomonas sp. TaxID=28214 RepID=UPI00307DF5D7
MVLGPDSCISRNGDILHSAIGDETVMMSVAAGEFYDLDPVAGRIWQLLEVPGTVAQLRDRLCAEFEVDPATCEADVLLFLGELQALDLVRVVAS